VRAPYGGAMPASPQPTLRARALPVLFLVALLAVVLAPPPAEAATERARITWNTQTDIDLHIYDEAGNHAFYAQPDAIPGASLSSDNTVGFGPETFTDDEDPGTARTFRFEVCYFAGSPDEGPTTVSGTIADGDGSSYPVSVTLAAPGVCSELGVSRGRGDGDGDGVPDSADRCPADPAPGTPDGCPSPPADGDGDGVPDSSDACPAQSAPGTANGCPEQADLVTTVDDPGRAVAAGREYTYTVRVRNLGPGTARNAVLDTDLPGSAALMYTRQPQGSCRGRTDLRCNLGTIAPGRTVPVQVRLITNQAGTGLSGGGPGLGGEGGVEIPAVARASARTKSATLPAAAYARSDAPDPNMVNNVERETTKVKTIRGTSRHSRGGTPRASAAEALQWGWHASSSENEWYGAKAFRAFRSGGRHGYGYMQAIGRAHQYNVASRFGGAYLEMWQAIDFRVQYYGYRNPNNPSTGQWTTILADIEAPRLSGAQSFGENPGLGRDPFQRVQRDRTTSRSAGLATGLFKFHMRNPNTTYRLQMRFSHYRDRIGPRDKVYETRWYNMVSFLSGDYTSG
jgi:Domain of unknown function DUF11/Thrombospondin type 3 repeat